MKKDTHHLRYIQSLQNPDGSFLALSSPDPHFHKSVKVYTTTFHTACIVHFLSSCKEKIAQEICTKACSYLIKNRSKNWTWNYWNKHSDEYTTKPYPDDADDTFCALSTLSLKQPESISGKTLASVVQILTSLESKEGGPYYTWLSSDPAWHDIDPAVNANIAYFLSLHDIELPPLTEYLETCIQTENLTSPYYPSSIHTAYFIARWYAGKHTRDLANFILSKQKAEGLWDNPLETFLAISSLIRLGLKDTILANFDSTVIQKPYPWCFDPVIDSKRHYSGSPALTTAAYIEANILIQHANLNQKSHVHSASEGHIKSYIHSLYDDCPAVMQAQAHKLIDAKLMNPSGMACAYISLICSRAIKAPPHSKYIDTLCLAHACGWFAYSLFDDMIDTEGQTMLLPIAQIAWDSMFLLFSSVAHLPQQKTYLETALLAMNKGLLQDTSYEKLPENRLYQHIFNRSLGYTIGPVFILLEKGYALDSPEVKNLLSYFRHFIIAKQLGDDAHDWEEDYRNRTHTLVTHLLDKAIYKEEAYWITIVPKVMTRIERHIKLSEQALQSNTAFDSIDELLQPLEKLNNMCKKTRLERKNALEFLAHYQE